MLQYHMRCCPNSGSRFLRSLPQKKISPKKLTGHQLLTDNKLAVLVAYLEYRIQLISMSVSERRALLNPFNPSKQSKNATYVPSNTASYAGSRNPHAQKPNRNPHRTLLTRGHSRFTCEQPQSSSSPSSSLSNPSRYLQLPHHLTSPLFSSWSSPYRPWPKWAWAHSMRRPCY